MVHKYGIEYKNVKLRQLNEADLEFLRNWRNNPENSRYLKKIPYITKEMQKDWYQKYLSRDNEMIFAIEERLELKKIVGSLSLYNITDKDAEFGKILIGDREAHGKQLGMNALKAVLMIAFGKLNLKTVYLYVFIANKQAIHSYKGAGMKVIFENNTEIGPEYKMSIDREQFLAQMEVEYA